MNPADSHPFCFECGLCCNGVIFADVRLQPGDDAAHLEAQGLPMARTRSKPTRAPRATRDSNLPRDARRPKFVQPCAAFDGCRCRIYLDRPQYCRHFECSLLQKLKDGRVDAVSGSRVVRSARRCADEVKRLLRELGDASENVALSVRVRRMRKRMETGKFDDDTAELFSRLTLAVHDLNVLLSEAFYPGR